MSQGSSHLDQDEQLRASVDHCAAGRALPLAPVPCLGRQTVVRRATSGLRGPSDDQAYRPTGGEAPGSWGAAAAPRALERSTHLPW